MQAAFVSRSSAVLHGAPKTWIKLVSAPRTNPRRENFAVHASIDPAIGSLALDIGTSLGAFGIPAAAGAALVLGAAKFAAYSQLEVVRTSMLSRHIRAGGARVVMLGDFNTRDLYYMPPKTIQVTVVGENLNSGLFAEAGVQAAVPVNPIKGSSIETLTAMPPASVDSVVAFDELSSTSSTASKLIEQIYRVLKPGGTFIFWQRVEGSPVASLLRLGSKGIAGQDIGDVVTNAKAWDFIQYDLASGALDPTAVGVAIKSLTEKAESDDDFSVDKQTFEQLMKRKKGAKKEERGFGGGAR